MPLVAGDGLAAFLQLLQIVLLSEIKSPGPEEVFRKRVRSWKSLVRLTATRGRTLKHGSRSPAQVS